MLPTVTNSHLCRVSQLLVQNTSIDLFKDDYANLKIKTRDLLLVDKDENKIKARFAVHVPDSC